MTLSGALKSQEYIAARHKYPDGHLVALLISRADSKIRWPGDFHWVRSDDPSGSHWSQKDGPGQITNFDFQGKPINDPSRATWTINLGPQRHRSKPAAGKVTEAKTEYCFAAWMYVPIGKVEIV
jgi:hypothetical protein